MTREPSGRYELAALDMDGTLLNTAHETTPFTRAALTRAAEAGKVIALCTGRCLSELWSHFEQNPGVAYAISENGGCLYDVKAGRALSQLTLEKARALTLLEMIAEYDACVQCFIDGQSYIQIESSEALEPYHVRDFAPVFEAGSIYVDDVTALARARGGVEKIDVYFARPEDKAAFWKRIEGFGLFVAVGDGGNDVDLMRAAGLSVAMGNATDAVKAAADAVTEDCDHDGAAKAVLRYLLGENV